MLTEWVVSTVIPASGSVEEDEPFSVTIKAPSKMRAIELMTDIVSYKLEDRGHQYVLCDEIAEGLEYVVT